VERLIGLTDGRQASYDVIGTGRPTLMLPGGPGLGAEYMRDQAELFADTLESYLIDPHGSGRSTPPRDTSAYSPEGHAAFYDEVRQALGLGDVLLLGHSFGATTALTYAALFPERVIGCIAVAAFGIGPDTGTAAASAAEAEYERALVRHAGAEWYPEARSVMDEWTERVLATDDPHEVEGMLRLVFPMYTAHPDRPDVAAGLTAMRRSLTADLAAVKAWEAGLYQTIDLPPLLAKITSPTLVVAGELDFLCGPAQAQPICAAIPGAQLEIIRDCGHFPTFEARQAYSEAVQRFLASHPGPTA
jgi:proline iminopeptidase